MSGRGSRTAAALLGTLAVPWLPLAAAALALHPRTRPDLRQRLGLSVPPVPMGVVWVHAASVGEIAAAEALVATLPGPVLLTADTDTGAERAREIAAASGGKVTAGVRPLDHPWTVAPLWAAARPRAVVLVEGTWSPQLAARCSAAGVPLARVSAKAGASTRRWARRWWYAPVTDATSLVVARDEGEAAWFRAAGCAHVVVGGDLKAARPLQASPLRRVGARVSTSVSSRARSTISSPRCG